VSSVWDFIKSEPAVIIAVLGACIAVLASFGLALSATQVSAVTALVTVVVGILTRQVVTSPRTVEDLLPPIVYSADRANPK
jgi:hypothetical protein